MAYDFLRNDWSSDVCSSDLVQEEFSATPGPLKQVMLFDIEQDPEEKHEVSAQHPEVVHFLLRRLDHYQREALPVTFPPEDPRCDPERLGGAWGPWA